MTKSLFGVALFVALIITVPAAAADNEDPELRCLAKNIYHEARGESIEGQIAVAVVTLNRVASPDYPDTICGVVYQAYQFSWTIKEPAIRKWKVYHQIKDLAHLAINHEIVSDVGDALHYHATTVPDPVTGKLIDFTPFWAPAMLQVAQIDNHVFYVQSQ